MKIDYAALRAPQSVPRTIWVWATAVIVPHIALIAMAAIHPERCIYPDSSRYLELATNLWTQHAFFISTESVRMIETFRTPGYPLFLIPFLALGPLKMAGIATVQTLITVGAAWAIWEFLRTRGLSPHAALWAASVILLDWVVLMHTPLVMADVFMLALMTFATLATVRVRENPNFRSAVAAGGLWSLAAIVKPIGLYLPILFIFFLWRRKAVLGIFLVAAYLLPALWIVRNVRIAQFHGLSSVGGVSLLRYAAGGTEAIRTGQPWVEIDRALRELVETRHPEIQFDEAKQGAEYAKAAKPILRASPGAFIHWNILGALRILGGTGIEMFVKAVGVETDQLQPAHRGSSTITGQGTRLLIKAYPPLLAVQLAYVIFLAILYVLAARGAWRLLRGSEKAFAGLLVVGALYFLALAAHQGYYRFRIPMMPFLAILSAYGFGSRSPIRSKPLQSAA